ncbi:MAG TPA: flippase-like domain-containing protein [Candidatus Saccharimonadales bacterium]
MRIPGSRSRLNWQQLLIPGVALIALYVLIPQIGGFHHSITLLRHVDFWGVAAATIFVMATYLAAAGTYFAIALHPIRYWRTVLVQVAGMFVNRLLPAGIGALGSNFAYLRTQKHSPAQAGAVVAMNNGLGLTGHALVLGSALLLWRDHLPPVQFSHGNSRIAWVAALGIGLLLVAVFSVPVWRQRLSRAFTSFAGQFLRFRERPLRLLMAQLSSIGLTLCNVLSLYYCVVAVHGSISFITVLLVFTLGVGLGTATPTPGGLGGFEAGLVAGFVAYGMPASEALAAALLYRLLSYWLAIGVGSVAFVYAQHRRVFGSAS